MLNTTTQTKTTISKTIRSEFPTVTKVTKPNTSFYLIDCRSRKYQMNTQYKRKTEKEALELHNSIKNKIINYGVTEIHKQTVVTNNRLDNLNSKLLPFGKTIEDLVTEFLNKQTFEANNALPNVDELLIEWEKYKLNNQLKPLAQATKDEVIQYARWMFMKWGKLNIKELTRETIESTLSNINAKNATRKQYWRYINNFINWCVDKKQLNIDNAAKGIEIKVEETAKEIYSVNDLKTMYGIIKKDFYDLLPHFLLTTFVGLRPSEAEKVTYAHIDFIHNEVYVLPENKTGSRRPKVYNVVMDNLKLWKQNNPDLPVIPDTVFSRVRDFRKAVKKAGVHWIPNGLRHMAVTYHYADHKDWNRIEYDFGHDRATSRKHYQRTISQGEIAAYWDLLK